MVEVQKGNKDSQISHAFPFKHSPLYLQQQLDSRDVCSSSLATTLNQNTSPEEVKTFAFLQSVL